MAAAPSELLQRMTDRLEETTIGRLVGRSVAGLVRVEVFDRAMTLAAQCFTSILPIVVATAAFNPRNGDQLGTTMAEQLGLPAEAAQVVETSIPDAATVQRSIGALGLVLILLSATSFSRALERMYVRIWDVPRPGLRGAWRWLATVLAISLAVLVMRLTRRVTDDWPYDLFLSLVVQLVLWTVVWTFVPWMLLQGQVPRRSMWASGGLSALALVVVSAAGTVYLPIALTAAARQFGSLGLAITYIGWLFVLCFAVVVGSVVGRAAALDEGWLGRLVRGPEPAPQPTSAAVSPGQPAPEESSSSPDQHSQRRSGAP